MNLLEKIRGLLFGSAGDEPHDEYGIYFYIKCGRCGAPIRVRVDRRHDLLRNYDGEGYILNKEIMDGNCFTLIYATIQFNEALRETKREINGGQFITWKEYRELTQAPATETPPSDGTN